MTRNLFAVVSSAVLSLAIGSTLAVAQVRDRAARADAPSDLSAISAGWAALASGRGDAAIRAASDVLARRPWDHRALQLKIEAESSSSPNAALDTYERWLGTRGPEDLGLLVSIAEGVLRQLASSADPDLKREAVEQLNGSRSGTSTSGGTYAADAAAARGGDAAALDRLRAAATAPMPPDKTALANALADAGPSAVPMLMPMLKAPGNSTRGAAAAALGKLKAQEAEPILVQMMKEPEPFIRMSAAVALARLGNQQAQQVVQSMLESPAADVRIMAAEAWDGQEGPWVAAITPLLNDPDGLARLKAAGLLARFDPEGARRTLTDALRDPNPVIRTESAKTLAQTASIGSGVADPALLRKMLRDPDPWMRLYGAEGVLAAVKAPR
jgi:HEAT repeat protein